MVRWPKLSSPDPRGDDPKFAILERPKAESCRFRRASVGKADFLGKEDGGDSRPNFEGTDAATGPCLAMYDIP